MVEVCAAFKRFSQEYYRKEAQVTNEHTQVVAALTIVQALYGRESAESFGPLKLQGGPKGHDCSRLVAQAQG